MYGQVYTSDPFTSNYFTLSNSYSSEVPLTLYNSNRPLVTPVLGGKVTLSFNDTVNLGSLLSPGLTTPITINMYTTSSGGGNFSNSATNWSQVSSSLDVGTAVAFGNNTFVAVGNIGASLALVRSSDGINWSLVSSNTNGTGRSVTYGNGIWVVGSDIGSRTSLSYMDGYYIAEAFGTLFDTSCYGLAFGVGVYVAVGSDATNNILYSLDGMTWSVASATSIGPVNGAAVTYANGVFVAVFNPVSIGADMLYTSSDGINWSIISGIIQQGTTVAYGNGQWLLYGTSNATSALFRSPDLSTWSEVSTQILTGFMTYGDTLIGSSSNLSDVIYQSPDNGTTWVFITDGLNNANYGACYGNGRYVVVGDNGDHNNIVTSSGINTISFSLQPTAIQPFL